MLQNFVPEDPQRTPKTGPKWALRVHKRSQKQTPRRQTIGRLGAPKRVTKSAESLPVIGAILGAAGQHNCVIWVSFGSHLGPIWRTEAPGFQLGGADLELHAWSSKRGVRVGILGRHLAPIGRHLVDFRCLLMPFGPWTTASMMVKRLKPFTPRVGPYGSNRHGFSWAWYLSGCTFNVHVFANLWVFLCNPPLLGFTPTAPCVPKWVHVQGFHGQYRREQKEVNKNNLHHLSGMHYSPQYVLDLFQMRLEQGIEHQPGPDSEVERVVSFVNVTSAFTNLEGLLKSKTTLDFIAEHSCNKTQAFTVKAKLAEKQRFAILSDLDPDAGHQTGGVAAISNDTCRTFSVKPATPDGRKLADSGRFAIFGSDLGCNHHFYFFVLYGWSGGREDPLLRQRTDGLIKAIRDELLHLPDGPKAMVADLNCDASQLPHLNLLVECASWTDIGAKASHWGGVDAQPTCQPNNAEMPSRIDYMFCNPEFIPFIRSFKVCASEDYPSHSIIYLGLGAPKAPMPRKINHQAPSLHNAFMEKFAIDHPAASIAKGTFREVWMRYLDKFHVILDDNLSKVAFSFGVDTTMGRTNEAWDTFCKAAQDAICTFLDIKGDDENKHHRRGKPHLRTWNGPAAQCAHANVERNEALLVHSAQTRRYLKLERTVKQWADRVRKLQSNLISQQRRTLFCEQNARAQRAVVDHFSSHDGNHISLAGYLGGHNGQASHALFFHLRRAEQSFHRLWLDSKKEDATLCQKAMQTYFANDPSRSKAFASLKGPGTPPSSSWSALPLAPGASRWGPLRLAPTRWMLSSEGVGGKCMKAIVRIRRS